MNISCHTRWDGLFKHRPDFNNNFVAIIESAYSDVGMDAFVARACFKNCCINPCHSGNGACVGVLRVALVNKSGKNSVGWVKAEVSTTGCLGEPLRSNSNNTVFWCRAAIDSYFNEKWNNLPEL